MEKFERYFFALLGLIIVILLVMVISMMNDQRTGTTYMPGYETGGMMRDGYYGQGGMMGEGYIYPYGADLKTEFDSSGEIIYYTGYNESGQMIDFTYGPNWLYVHGGSCINCHGVDGKGGVPIMMAYALPSDITYDSLTSEDHEMEDGEEHEVYTDESIKVAIKEGVEPSGEELDLVMPRWDMSDKDLDDIIEYLKEL